MHNYYWLTKAVKKVNKFQQICRPETFNNLNLVNELKNSCDKLQIFKVKSVDQGIQKPIISYLH